MIELFLPHMSCLCATKLDFFASILLMPTLFWLSWFDLKHHRLPNVGTLSLVWVGLSLSVWREQGIAYDFLIGASAGYAVFAVIGAVYFRTRGVDGLGLGDAKLLAAGGAWLGWQSLPTVILLSSLGGLAMILCRPKAMRGQIPFGPALAIAFSLHWLVFLAYDYV